MRTIVDGWDAFELWVTQLAFPFQVALVIVVLLPLCAVVATVVDRLTERFDHPTRVDAVDDDQRAGGDTRRI